MADRLDVGSLAPGDRADAIREFSWAINGHIEVGLPPNPQNLRAVATTNAVGSVKVSKIGWNVARLRRAVPPVNEDVVPHVHVHFQEAGVSRIHQGGRQGLTRSGDLVVLENAKPYDVFFHGAMRSVLVRVPTRVLGLRSPLLEQVTAVPLSTQHQVAGATAAFFTRLAREQAAAGETETALLSQPCVDLVRALVTMALGRDDLARAPLNNTLLQRVQEYVRLHLAEPDLTAARIAAEHHVSVRQLYLTLSRAGITLGDWMRTQRLEECKRELASSAHRFMTIEAIAHRWGFTSAPHFSRVFKAAYGVSPREWRLEQAAGSADFPQPTEPRRPDTASG
ncbi:helix-turn-helix domain-containing protein [Actinacidiphila sp. bgisy160]|uniref:helix-turn-helix domain-containing protein n=1 Tax=Actinacidiphila sp. bgisy160 TaxID=3413796 RepID=UPI003D72F58A